MKEIASLLVFILFFTGCSISSTAQKEVNAFDATALQKNEVCTFIEGKINKGRMPGTLIGSTMLTPNGPVENGALHVRLNGLIGAVGDFDKLSKAYPNAAVLDCRGTTVLSPGWVNAHEHVAYSYAYPDQNLGPVYSHRDEWRLGLNGKTKLPSPKSFYYKKGKNLEGNAKLIWIETRHLLSGTTSIAGSGGVPGLAENINLHKYASDPSIYAYEANMSTFPYSSNAIRDFRDKCQDPSNKAPNLRIDHNLTSIPYVPHIGEGARNDCTAIYEAKEYIDGLTAGKRRYSLIHGISLNDGLYKKLAGKDVTLVWSPRSNLALYGQTIDLENAKKHKARLSLGSDWSPSGSFNMIEEMKCAAKVAKSENISINDKDLWEMATHNSSYALGLEDDVGSLKSGLKANFFIARRNGQPSAYSSAVKANTDDIVGVWVNGSPVVLSKSLGGVISDKPLECAVVGHINKMLCIKLSDYGLTQGQLQKYNKNSVPLTGGYSQQANCETK